MLADPPENDEGEQDRKKYDNTGKIQIGDADGRQDIGERGAVAVNDDDARVCLRHQSDNRNGIGANARSTPLDFVLAAHRLGLFGMLNTVAATLML